MKTQVKNHAMSIEAVQAPFGRRNNPKTGWRQCSKPGHAGLRSAANGWLWCGQAARRAARMRRVLSAVFRAAPPCSLIN